MDWSLVGRNSRCVSYPTSDTGYFVEVTWTSEDTKGDWVEICSGTPFNVSGFSFTGRFDFNKTATAFVDIGIGADGSEVVIVENLRFYTNTWLVASGSTYYLPLSIPSGTRIAVRAQNSSYDQYDNVDINCNISLFPHPSFASAPFPLHRCVTYGENVYTTTGLQFTLGANTWGSWQLFCAAVPFNTRSMILSLDSEVGESSPIGGAFQIGIGDPGSEYPICSNMPTWLSYCDTGYSPNNNLFLPVEIPTNSVLSIRGKSSSTTTEKDANVIAYLFG